MREMSEMEALYKAAKYCAISEHCRQEVKVKLKEWNQSDEAIERILTALETENYLNEVRYCEKFIHDKIYLNKWGKNKIAQVLYYKQISDPVIKQGMNEINEKEYLAILTKLLENKKRTIKAKNEYELKAKLTRYAYGKGFSMEDIDRAMEN